MKTAQRSAKRSPTTDSHIPLGQLEQDLAFYTDQPFRDYQPRFGLDQQDKQTIWFTDHGRRVALLDKKDNQIELIEFCPGKPRLRNPQKPPVYHAPTQLGARLTLVQWIGVMGRTSDECEYVIDPTPERIVLTVTEKWHKRVIHSVKRLELRVDPRLGYVLTTADEFRSAEPLSVELYNFLAVGLTHHHPAHRRYPYVIWRSPSRGLLKWTSNMISLGCPGHQDKLVARTIGTDGWDGYFGERDWNPVFALAAASEPCRLSTCDNLLDEHFGFGAPATKTGNEYVLTCRGVLVALPGKVAEELIERATVNDLRADPYHSQLRTFFLNQVCDFEKPVDLTAYYRGVYWRVPENGKEWATVSDEQAHSGRWSLRLRVRPEDGEKSISPQGSSMWLDSGRSYRLSAWVRYTGQGAGQFRLCASQAYMSFADNRDPQEAQLAATAPTEWKRLELTFTALPNSPCVFVQLKAQGDGNWFVDDILLEETSK